MMIMTHLDIDDIRSIIAHSFDVNEERLRYLDKNKASETFQCYIPLSAYGKTFKGNIFINA